MVLTKAIPSTNERQRDELKRVIIEQMHADISFAARFNWTLQLIADLHLSHTKPTYVLAGADPEKQKILSKKRFLP